MAQSKDELIAIIGTVKSFGAPLKFSHSRYKLLALFTGLIALTMGLFSDEFYIKFHYQSTAFTVFFALCTAALIFMWRKVPVCVLWPNDSISGLCYSITSYTN